MGVYQWRWREWNPRPPAANQDFSGRSLLQLFLSPGDPTDTSPSRAQSLLMSPQTP